MNRRTAVLILFNQAHLANDTTRSHVFVDHVAAADLQRAGLNNVHAGRRITLRERNLAPLQIDMRIVANKRSQFRISKLTNSAALGTVGRSPALPAGFVLLRAATI